MEKFVDDNVERGKETYPRDDTSGHVCGQASFELVLLYGGGYEATPFVRPERGCAGYARLLDSNAD